MKVAYVKALFAVLVIMVLFPSLIGHYLGYAKSLLEALLDAIRF